MATAVLHVWLSFGADRESPTSVQRPAPRLQCRPPRMRVFASPGTHLRVLSLAPAHACCANRDQYALDLELYWSSPSPLQSQMSHPRSSSCSSHCPCRRIWYLYLRGSLRGPERCFFSFPPPSRSESTRARFAVGPSAPCATGPINVWHGPVWLLRVGSMASTPSTSRIWWPMHCTSSPS
jgi:hypothetical protein